MEASSFWNCKVVVPSHSQGRPNEANVSCRLLVVSASSPCFHRQPLQQHNNTSRRLLDDRHEIQLPPTCSSGLLDQGGYEFLQRAYLFHWSGPFFSHCSLQSAGGAVTRARPGIAHGRSFYSSSAFNGDKVPEVSKQETQTRCNCDQHHTAFLSYHWLYFHSFLTQPCSKLFNFFFGEHKASKCCGENIKTSILSRKHVLQFSISTRIWSIEWLYLLVICDCMDWNEISG